MYLDHFWEEDDRIISGVLCTPYRALLASLVSCSGLEIPFLNADAHQLHPSEIHDSPRSNWRKFEQHDDVIKWKHFPCYWPYERGILPVTGEFSAQRPVTRSFDVFFDLHLNKQLSKQSWCWWFETLSRSLWRHCNDELSLDKLKNWFISSSPPSAAYTRQWIGSALVQIMAGCLFGAKPLSKPMLDCHQLGPWEQTSVKF